MGFKKQAIATVAILSLLAGNVGLANFATANARASSSQPSEISTSCAEAQNAINSIGSAGIVRITEDCVANLIIPSGKSIQLKLSSIGNDGLDIYHTLTNDGGDTITVENGALFLYYLGGEQLTNSTPGKSVINNAGTATIWGNLVASNNANMLANSGELNIIDGNYTGTTIQNSGRIRIARGNFDNAIAIKPYVVKGAILDENTGAVVQEAELNTYPNFVDDDTRNICHGNLPVGYTCYLATEYPDYADAMGERFESSDESVIKVAGSNIDGWTITVVGAGEASLMRLTGTPPFLGAGIGSRITGYTVPIDSSDTTESFTKHLINKFLDILKQAIENNKSISIEIKIGEKSDGSNIDEGQKTEIANVAGSDSIVGYYDINLALKADNEELTNITDLENDTVEVRLPADFVNDLEEVKSGYKRNYYVIRYHEGVAEKIAAQLDGDELVFRSGKFSTYAVAYTDTKTTSGSTSGGSHSGSNTGSNSSSSSNTNTDSSNNSSTGNNDSNSSSSNSSNAGVNAPDTGIAAYLGSSATPVALAGLVATSVAAGFAAYKVASRKQRHSK